MRTAAVFLLTCLFGCTLSPSKTKPPPLGPGEVVSAHAARDTVSIGKSTQAEVRAALGKAVEIDFDSGYEVWVYRERLREKQPPPPTELVLLFSPSGTLAKARTR